MRGHGFIAVQLQRRDGYGERVLLLFPPGLDFVAAFLGCLYAGAVAAPAYPPRPGREQPRLRAILPRCAASLRPDDPCDRLETGCAGRTGMPGLAGLEVLDEER